MNLTFVLLYSQLCSFTLIESGFNETARRSLKILRPSSNTRSQLSTDGELFFSGELIFDPLVGFQSTKAFPAVIIKKNENENERKENVNRFIRIRLFALCLMSMQQIGHTATKVWLQSEPQRPCCRVLLSTEYVAMSSIEATSKIVL